MQFLSSGNLPGNRLANGHAEQRASDRSEDGNVRYPVRLVRIDQSDFILVASAVIDKTGRGIDGDHVFRQLVGFHDIGPVQFVLKAFDTRNVFVSGISQHLFEPFVVIRRYGDRWSFIHGRSLVVPDSGYPVAGPAVKKIFPSGDLSRLWFRWVKTDQNGGRSKNPAELQDTIRPEDDD